MLNPCVVIRATLWSWDAVGMIHLYLYETSLVSCCVIRLKIRSRRFGPSFYFSRTLPTSSWSWFPRWRRSTESFRTKRNAPSPKFFASTFLEKRKNLFTQFLRQTRVLLLKHEDCFFFAFHRKKFYFYKSTTKRISRKFFNEIESLPTLAWRKARPSWPPSAAFVRAGPNVEQIEDSSSRLHRTANLQSNHPTDLTSDKARKLDSPIRHSAPREKSKCHKPEGEKPIVKKSLKPPNGKNDWEN